MRSDIDSASSWSCVTKMNVMPTWVCSSFSSICISWRSLRSSAPRGSSSRSTDGWLTSARASATRCCWPPDSWRGLRPRERRHLHHVERLAHPSRGLGLVDALLPQAVGDVLGHRHVREERVVLEDRVDVALVGSDALHVLARDPDVALVGLLEPGQHAQGRRLAAPARTEQRQELPRLHVEVEAVDRDHRPEALRDVGELDRPALAAHDRVHLPPAGPRARHGDVRDLAPGHRADVVGRARRGRHDVPRR